MTKLINETGTCFIVCDDSLEEFNKSEFRRWLKEEGFSPWTHSKWYRTTWIYINIDTKLYAKGMYGIDVAGHIRHAITISEFKTIYSIFKKYENWPILVMSEEENR